MGIFKTVKEAKEFISEYGGEKIKYAPCDVFDIAEALYFATRRGLEGLDDQTKAISEALVRAFVQGATWAIYPLDNSEEAKTKAAFLLERGWLGKEEE